MSRRQKLERFEALTMMPHVFQNFTYDPPQLTNHKGQEVKLANRWHEHFNRKAPLVLELACGRGEYCIGLAQLHPESNYIGIDVKGARIHQGARKSQELMLDQVAFLRTKIEFVDLFFGQEEVDTIWITFPDPFLKTHKANRRLTSPAFIERYRKVLKRNGTVKLKTDSPELFAFTLQTIKADPRIKILNQIENVHKVDHGLPELDIITYYEKLHLADNRIINYIEFSI